MLAIFHKAFAHPPEELNSPASQSGSKKPKLPEETLREFMSHHPDATFSMSFGDAAVLAYVKPQNRFLTNQRIFSGYDDIFCLFLGSLNNLCTLNKQYGLPKISNEAMFLIEAYRTLRDRGPYPADQVVKDLDGSFAFIVYDSKGGNVFVALGSDGGVQLFWGIAADGSVVISDDLEVIKAGCANAVDAALAPFKLVKLTTCPYVLCYRLPEAIFLSQLPSVEYHFVGGAVLPVISESVFSINVQEKYFMLTMLPGDINILGAHHQQDVRVLYDLEAKQLSWISADCSKDV